MSNPTAAAVFITELSSSLLKTATYPPSVSSASVRRHSAVTIEPSALVRYSVTLSSGSFTGSATITCTEMVLPLHSGLKLTAVPLRVKDCAMPEAKGSFHLCTTASLWMDGFTVSTFTKTQYAGFT